MALSPMWITCHSQKTLYGIMFAVSKKVELILNYYKHEKIIT